MMVSISNSGGNLRGLHSSLGTVHGFTARPNLAIPQVKEMSEKAFDDAVDWLVSHL
jgi:hypothetical protein